MPGLLSGRHRGAAEARGEILAYLDDDAVLAPTWLESLKDAFQDPVVSLVGGPSSPLYDIPPPHWAKALWLEVEEGLICGSLSLMDLGKTRKVIDPLFVWGVNLSIRKSIFLECGGFHPDCIPKSLQRYQGDGETGLTLKVKENRLLAVYHPGVAVAHIIPASRLTPEALEQRGFYQGVCDSYTRIRRDGYATASRQRSWKEVARATKWKLERQTIVRRPTSENILVLVGRARTAGARFHQDEVQKDPGLLEWVLRANYLDYTLPGGWQRYTSSARSIT
jgi:glucosyl-dolichyl phosphate glucuronosyltransferase